MRGKFGGNLSNDDADFADSASTHSTAMDFRARGGPKAAPSPLAGEGWGGG
jgi:hypothetical protein